MISHHSPVGLVVIALDHGAVDIALAHIRRFQYQHGRRTFMPPTALIATIALTTESPLGKQAFL